MVLLLCSGGFRFETITYTAHTTNHTIYLPRALKQFFQRDYRDILASILIAVQNTLLLCRTELTYPLGHAPSIV